MIDSNDKYISDIKKLSVLTREDEQDLLPLAKTDVRARQRVIEKSMRFVMSTAFKFVKMTKSRAEISDLISEGVFGLNKAIDDFNPRNGVRFLTYAVWQIRANMSRFNYHQTSAVALQESWKLRKNVDQLLTKPERIDSIVPGTDSTYADVLTADDDGLTGIRLREVRRVVDACLSNVTSKDSDIFRRAVLASDPKTMSSLANEYRVSPPTVANRIKHVRKKLREFVEENQILF